jgi:NADPH:quinone reductase-like Zn-dependent oxidoreductase
VRARGAEAVIDYRHVSVTDAIRRAFPGGIDAVIDLVSDAEHLDELSRVLRPGGIVVSTVSAANVRTLALRSVRGVNVGFRPTIELLRRVTKAVDDGRLRPGGVHTVSFDHAQQALDDLAGGHVHGKLVLTTG